MKCGRANGVNHAMSILDGGGHFLCGVSSSGDDDLGLEESIEKDGDIDCPQCLKVIDYCYNLYCKIIEENK